MVLHRTDRQDLVCGAAVPGVSGSFARKDKTAVVGAPSDYKPPAYLDAYYWWAYARPAAVRFFERQWLINLILWGNYKRLRDQALDELGERLPGRTLQLACVYGDLTKRLSARAASAGGAVDVVDALSLQLENLRKKLPAEAPVRLMVRNAADLRLPSDSYERVLIFFLLHEQPRDVRIATLAEALRVLKPGGKLAIVDYAKPRQWHPAHWLWYPIIGRLEPFAKDFWSSDVRGFLPWPWNERPVRRAEFFGGLYQKLVLRK